MLIALIGVTGVGKSYYTECIVNELGFKKVNTIRTREKRAGEKEGKTGLFRTKEELDVLEKEGKLAYRFSIFGGEYAYLKDEIMSDEDYVFEMHYTKVEEWKELKKDMVSIYILPNDIEIPMAKLKERNLSEDKEKERLDEIMEQYKKVTESDEYKFDYIVYNNYDEESKNKLIELVKEIKAL